MAERWRTQAWNGPYVYEVEVWDESGDTAVLVDRFDDIVARDDDAARDAALGELDREGESLVALIESRRRADL